MNTKALCLALVASLATPFLIGQTAVTGGTAEKAAAYSKRMTDARLLARTSDVATVEQTLTSLNRSKADTSAWHSETASRLLQLASTMGRDGQPAIARSLATRAVARLEDAIRLARSKTATSGALATLGVTYERYFGNNALALAYYRKAVEANPKNASAAEAAQRIEQTEIHLNSKGNQKGR